MEICSLMFDHQIDPSLEDLLRRMLDKDSKTRITLGDIKVSVVVEIVNELFQKHSWVTKNGQLPMHDKYEELWVTEEEVRTAVKHRNNLPFLLVTVLVPKVHSEFNSAESQNNDEEAEQEP